MTQARARKYYYSLLLMLALALALAEQSGGTITPPVGYAFERARDASPGNIAPGYFLGLLALRGGALAEARDLWADALSQASENAMGREFVSQQLERLEGVIRVLGDGATQRGPQAGPMMPPPATPR